MYSELWSQGLRQGDVVGPIAFPLLGTQFERVSPSESLVDPPPLDASSKIIVPAKASLVVIISHDCEFNEGKRNKLLVARLQSVPGHYTSEQLKALRESNDLEARVTNQLNVAGIDNWMFAPIAEVFDTEQVANFGTTTPLPMKLADELLARKHAELVHEQRVLFRKKLAYFLGRDAEDVPQDKKQPRPAPANSDAN
ncbi:MAG: hypothetical protein DLM64_08870 [Solirubrobacterales bacterium]|nr:MAG: hypothetical protein DLM64_08870 [Solirubrobacterales bacterium]